MSLKGLGVEKFCVLCWSVLGNREFFPSESAGNVLAAPSASDYWPTESASDYLARPNCRSRGYELEIGNWML